MKKTSIALLVLAVISVIDYWITKDISMWIQCWGALIMAAINEK